MNRNAGFLGRCNGRLGLLGYGIGVVGWCWHYIGIDRTDAQAGQGNAVIMNLGAMPPRVKSYESSVGTNSGTHAVSLCYDNSSRGLCVLPSKKFLWLGSLPFNKLRLLPIPILMAVHLISHALHRHRFGWIKVAVF